MTPTGSMTPTDTASVGGTPVRPDRLRFSTLIIFSGLDDPFLDVCLDGVIPASERVLALAYDRLFDGSDDRAGVEAMVARNANKNVEMEILPLPENPTEDDWFYHNWLRREGFRRLEASADYTLFLDGDEVAEPAALRAWRDRYGPRPGNFFFPCHFYFREPIYQSLTPHASPRMARNDLLRAALGWGGEAFVRDNKVDRASYDFEPRYPVPEILFHHFSFVRTKEQMLRKVRTWADRYERPRDVWEALVEREFSRPFTGRDFRWGYSYRTVPNRFGIRL